MTEKIRKAGSVTALAVGGTINIAALLSMVYQAGGKSAELAEVRQKQTLYQVANDSRVSAVEASVVLTRQKIDDKFDQLIRAVSRIEGRLERGLK